MKRKIVLLFVATLCGGLLAGCDNIGQEQIPTVESQQIVTGNTEGDSQIENAGTVAEEPAIDADSTTGSVPVQNEAVEDTQQESAEIQAGEEQGTALSFADLSTIRFEFSSGAGGWWEEFTIEKDGYFTGHYHDSDMGDTGEDYENGTVYSSSYRGHFTDLTKINDYTYTMKLSDITYKEPADTTDIIEGVRYIYTTSYCLEGADTFYVYLPGTPLSEFSEEVVSWLQFANESETELTMMAIVNKQEEYGVYSYERMKPLEDAQTTYANYKESYDYYGEKLSQATTTREMVEYTGRMYELSDECLNYIWNLIRYNVDETEYQEILTKQREWISFKEAQADAIRADYQGGTMGPVDVNDTLATLTMKRCEELIEYLK